MKSNKNKTGTVIANNIVMKKEINTIINLKIRDKAYYFNVFSPFFSLGNKPLHKGSEGSNRDFPLTRLLSEQFHRKILIAGRAISLYSLRIRVKDSFKIKKGKNEK